MCVMFFFLLLSWGYVIDPFTSIFRVLCDLREEMAAVPLTCKLILTVLSFFIILCFFFSFRFGPGVLLKEKVPSLTPDKKSDDESIIGPRSIPRLGAGYRDFFREECEVPSGRSLEDRIAKY
ncbi:hypothetical protein EYR41_012124 [Orbilia oligospora]|uniref:Uncharacterized protein n=1 Tax=Orbilia oligospora TaxID=2813651 RepID=A0A8H2HJF7_ORBOL|nr:hypothetical protein EYR41_012124 [Orbilia oligospora]